MKVTALVVALVFFTGTLVGFVLESALDIEHKLSSVKRKSAVSPNGRHRPGSPRLVVNESEYDFGRAELGTVVSHAFHLKNAGDAPLKIDRVSASCGCTVPQLESTNIMPGEGSTIRVETLQARRRVGSSAR